MIDERTELKSNIANVLSVLSSVDEVIPPAESLFLGPLDISNESFVLLDLSYFEPRPIRRIDTVLPPSAFISKNLLLDELTRSRAKELLLLPNSVAPCEEKYSSRPNKKARLDQSVSSFTSPNSQDNPLLTIRKTLPKKGEASSSQATSDIPPDCVQMLLSIRQQDCCKSMGVRFRQYQSDQWKERFEDLIAFKQEYGHCLVPHKYREKPMLSQWVKRQRSQYKLKYEHRHSSLTDTREAKLEAMGFIWDSHKASWNEKLEVLKRFKACTGHCMVPMQSEADRSLAVWVKNQRRQMKAYVLGEKTSMTNDRCKALLKLGFEWNP